MPFPTNPAAPARSACATFSSVSYVVRISTRVSRRSGSAQISVVAPRPSASGIRMSITTTSGRSSRASRTASRPSPASPTTLMSSVLSNSSRKAPRNSAWSSASSTFSVMGCALRP